MLFLFVHYRFATRRTVELKYCTCEFSWL